MKKHIVKRIMAILACGAVLLMSLTGCGNQGTPSSSTVAELINSPISVANRLDEAFSNPNDIDGQTIVDLIPNEVVEGAISNNNLSSEAEFVNMLEEGFGYSLKYIESMGGSYEFYVGDATPVSSSQLNDIQEVYLDQFELEVSEAQTVKNTCTVTYQGETRDQNMDISVIKINKIWYLDVYSMAGISNNSANESFDPYLATIPSSNISENINSYSASSNSPGGMAQRYTNAILNHDETSGLTFEGQSSEQPNGHSSSEN